MMWAQFAVVIGALCLSISGFHAAWRFSRPTDQELVFVEVARFRLVLVIWVGGDAAIVLLMTIISALTELGVIPDSSLFVGGWGVLVLHNVLCLLLIRGDAIKVVEMLQALKSACDVGATANDAPA